MAKFKFRLATLLRLREAARDERRGELADAYRVDDLLGRQLDRLEEELGWLQQQCRRVAAPGTVDVDRLVEGQRYELKPAQGYSFGGLVQAHPGPLA